MPTENIENYDPIRVHPYYQLLRGIQETTRAIEVMEDLASINLFTVDLDAREIIAPPDYLGFVGVAGEHESETITFKVDRYYENIDLANMTIVVEYINADGEGRVVPILTRDFQTFENQIMFDWILDSEITKKAGKVQFDIRFYMVGDAEDPVTQNRGLVYSLRTKPFESTILPTLPLNTDEFYEEYSEILADEFTSLIGAVRALDSKIDNKELLWVDVI